MTSEIEKLRHLTEITQSTLRKYEVRGVFRAIEETPAGRKCYYSEMSIGRMPLEHLYAGVIFVCPKGDRTNGRMQLEVSVRDHTIRVMGSASSADAAELLDEYRKKGYNFTVVL